MNEIIGPPKAFFIVNNKRYLYEVIEHNVRVDDPKDIALKLNEMNEMIDKNIDYLYHHLKLMQKVEPLLVWRHFKRFKVNGNDLSISAKFVIVCDDQVELVKAKILEGSCEVDKYELDN